MNTFRFNILFIYQLKFKAEKSNFSLQILNKTKLRFCMEMWNILHRSSNEERLKFLSMQSLKVILVNVLNKKQLSHTFEHYLIFGKNIILKT